MNAGIGSVVMLLIGLGTAPAADQAATFGGRLLAIKDTRAHIRPNRC
jgi:hypothetical protein